MRIDGVFCICVLCFCLLPVSRLHFADKDTTENRTLARFPTIWTSDGRLNTEFGDDAERWLNDHITIRYKLLSVYKILERCISLDRIETKRAFTGEVDWLFYINNVGDSDSLKLFQNRLPFTETQLMDIYYNLEQQNMWLDSHGISYIVFVAPNKEDVYGEYYPKGISKVSPKDRVALLGEYLQKNKSAVSFLYPLEDLLKHKTDGLLYYKNDTHWSPLGAYWGYYVLMQEVKKLLPDIDVLSLDMLLLKQSAYPGGDLNNMLPSVAIDPYKDVLYATPTLPNGARYSEEVINNDLGEGAKRIHTINPYGKYKAIVFRDSFSDALIPYLSESFREVYYIFTHDLNPYKELIEKEHPDIVVHEVVSRGADALVIKTPHWALEGEGKN